MNKLNELENILKLNNITITFQPIISLKNSTILGYEALIGGPKNSPLVNHKKLFETAKIYNKTYDLECTYFRKVIERSCALNLDKLLFIKINPAILQGKGFRENFTDGFLKKHDISPQNIVFEITENIYIKDYENFKEDLNYYIEQGCKIAIDDVGSGHFGLKMISQVKPFYIKIDMRLIVNIRNDPFKQHLVKWLVNLSNKANIKLIAKKVEVKEDLIKLIDLGVQAGQGYLIQHPFEFIYDDVNQEIRNIISDSRRHNLMKIKT